ncbi:MAG: hypothetical protein ACKV2T_44005 [Kofleriaceae bacterium]
MKSLLVLVGLLIGCGPSLGAAYQPTPLTDPNKAIVYLYRPSKFMGGGSTVFLGVVQNNIGWSLELHNGGYIAYLADPGPIVVTGANLGDNTAAGFAVEARREYFVRVTVDSLEITQIPPEVGSVEIRECRADGGTPKRISTSTHATNAVAQTEAR